MGRGRGPGWGEIDAGSGGAQGIRIGATGRRGTLQAPEDQGPARRLGPEDPVLVLAVEVEGLAASKVQRDGIDRSAIGGVPPPIEFERAGTEVDEDGAGVGVGRVAVPGMTCCFRGVRRSWPVPTGLPGRCARPLQAPAVEAGCLARRRTGRQGSGGAPVPVACAGCSRSGCYAARDRPGLSSSVPIGQPGGGFSLGDVPTGLPPSARLPAIPQAAPAGPRGGRPAAPATCCPWSSLRRCQVGRSERPASGDPVERSASMSAGWPRFTLGGSADWDSVRCSRQAFAELWPSCRGLASCALPCRDQGVRATGQQVGRTAVAPVLTSRGTGLIWDYYFPFYQGLMIHVRCEIGSVASGGSSVAGWRSCSRGSS